MTRWAVDLAKEIVKRNNPKVIGAVVGTVVSANKIEVNYMDSSIIVNDFIAIEGIVENLEAGDKVLMLPTQDNQQFFLLGKIEVVGGE